MSAESLLAACELHFPSPLLNITLLYLDFPSSLCAMNFGSQLALYQAIVAAHPSLNSMIGSYFKSLFAADMSKYLCIISILTAKGFSLTLKFTTCFGVPVGRRYNCGVSKHTTHNAI